MKWLAFHALDALGYVLCEIAFRADCRGPFALAYRAGCSAYDAASALGVKWGLLVPNPSFGLPDEPELIRA